MESLIDENKEHVKDEAKLKDLAVEFYRSLFTSKKVSGRQFMRGCFPTLSDAATGMLEARFSKEETKKVLMGNGVTQSPKTIWVSTHFLQGHM